MNSQPSITSIPSWAIDTLINNSRKPHTCSKCGDLIPIRSSYHKTKPRYGSASIRCMKYECRFRPTDLSSAKTARIEEAIENAEIEIQTADDHDAIQSVLESVTEVAREVGKEYQEASDNWAGGNGHEEFQEKADACESFASTLESWSYSGETKEETINERSRRASQEEV